MCLANQLYKGHTTFQRNSSVTETLRRVKGNPQESEGQKMPTDRHFFFAFFGWVRSKTLPKKISAQFDKKKKYPLP